MDNADVKVFAELVDKDDFLFDFVDVIVKKAEENAEKGSLVGGR